MQSEINAVPEATSAPAVSMSLMSLDGEEFFYPSAHQFKEANTPQYKLGLKAALDRGSVVIRRDCDQHTITVEGRLSDRQFLKLKREVRKLKWRLERHRPPTLRKPGGMEILYRPRWRVFA